MRTVGKNGLAVIKYFEKCRLIAFKPIPTDPWTLGWGRTREIKEGQTCTQEQADRWLFEDADEAAQGVVYLVKQPITQNQFDALVSFAYNVGTDIDADILPEGLGDSTLLRLVNAGEFVKAAEEFLKWNKAKGKVLGGLTRRRIIEKELFLTPDSQLFKVGA